MNNPREDTTHPTRQPDRRGSHGSRAGDAGLALSALGVAAVALAACGGSSSASTTTSTGRSSAAGGQWSWRPAVPRQFPGTSGTIAAINGTSLEVQSTDTGQTTVSYTSTTRSNRRCRPPPPM